MPYNQPEVRNMMTTGQFAARFRVSRKLLRHYNEIGLLTPHHVDSENSYAFYGDAECERMRRILALRSLQLPLETIGTMIDMPEADWQKSLADHLAVIRAKRRKLLQAETEITAILARIRAGEEAFHIMGRETEFTYDVFRLDRSIHITGRAARLKAGSPEHMPAIEALIEGFYGDDAPAMIPGRLPDALRFGICAELDHTDGTFTYMMGDEVVPDAAVPEGMRAYTIPPGHYARLRFAARDTETLVGPVLGDACDRIYKCIDSDPGWQCSDTTDYEVYPADRFEVPLWPEMELWVPVRPR